MANQEQEKDPEESFRKASMVLMMLVSYSLVNSPDSMSYL